MLVELLVLKGIFLYKL
ncbi:hypothetical protein Ccrd_020951 [Cynara cardunculus var. scolymus]|uniref:Uncharacterized protein n=1 Tax=Cynara cardunculus var. scolymus TaxID=59895 RepID=A0A124SEP7_CYNCS|nr:hypothetical protein Ccrd_020951 [Cynara cardunculus var. scolymus]